MNEIFSILKSSIEKFIVFLGLFVIACSIAFYAVVQAWLPMFPVSPVINFNQLFSAFVYGLLASVAIVIVYYKLRNR